MLFEIVGISKYGNAALNVSGAAFLKMGFECGDIVTVTLPSGRFDMPVGSNYSDVDSGGMLLQVNIEPGRRDEAVVLAVNMGSMAERAGLTDIAGSVRASVELKAKNGYLGGYLIHRMDKTDVRGDYPHLTDAQFANFRMIETPGMGRGALYRSSSPVNPVIGRSACADGAMRQAGVKCVLNLADSEEEMRAFPGFEGSYYASCDVICLNLSVSCASPSFRAGLAAGLRFMLAHDGPYLTHCRDGRDRTGFVSALLECLMGACCRDVIEDYMETFRCFYGVDRGEKRYGLVARNNFCTGLAEAFGTDGIEGRDGELAALAAAYLEGLGLSKAEIGFLKEKLAENRLPGCR